VRSSAPATCPAHVRSLPAVAGAPHDRRRLCLLPFAADPDGFTAGIVSFADLGVPESTMPWSGACRERRQGLAEQTASVRDFVDPTIVLAIVATNGEPGRSGSRSPSRRALHADLAAVVLDAHLCVAESYLYGGVPRCGSASIWVRTVRATTVHPRRRPDGDGPAEKVVASTAQQSPAPLAKNCPEGTSSFRIASSTSA
jgi:hypothetical protein